MTKGYSSTPIVYVFSNREFSSKNIDFRKIVLELRVDEATRVCDASSNWEFSFKNVDFRIKSEFHKFNDYLIDPSLVKN